MARDFPARELLVTINYLIYKNFLYLRLLTRPMKALKRTLAAGMIRRGLKERDLPLGELESKHSEPTHKYLRDFLNQVRRYYWMVPQG